MICGVVATAMVVPSLASAGPVTQWDQRNDGPIDFPTSNVGAGAASLTFSPSLSGVDAVQMCLGSTGASSDVAVEIREGSKTGAVLGASGSETVEPGAPEALIPRLTTFEFASPVALTPGDTYAIRAVLVSGSNAWAWGTQDLDDPGSSGGLWFREGLGVDVTDVDPSDAASYVAAPTCPGA